MYISIVLYIFNNRTKNYNYKYLKITQIKNIMYTYTIYLLT